MAEAMPSVQTVIHPTAIMSPRAVIGQGVHIGPYCTVGDHVVLHDRAQGCETTVFPAETPAAEIAAGGFDGVFLSNGPGDPAATRTGSPPFVDSSARCRSSGSVWATSCSRSRSGGRTFKMRFGHRGVNQPVKNLRTGHRRDHEPQPRLRGRSARVGAHRERHPAGRDRLRRRRAHATGT